MKKLKLIFNSNLVTIIMSLIFVSMLFINITMAYYRDSYADDSGDFILGSVDISAVVNGGESFNLTASELLSGETTLRSITVSNNGLDDVYIRMRPIITLDSASTSLITMDVDSGGSDWALNADTWIYYSSALISGNAVAVDTDILVSSAMTNNSASLPVNIQIEIQATQVSNNTADPISANWTT